MAKIKVSCRGVFKPIDFPEELSPESELKLYALCQAAGVMKGRYRKSHHKGQKLTKLRS